MHPSLQRLESIQFSFFPRQVSHDYGAGSEYERGSFPSRAESEFIWLVVSSVSPQGLRPDYCEHQQERLPTSLLLLFTPEREEAQERPDTHEQHEGSETDAASAIASGKEACETIEVDEG